MLHRQIISSGSWCIEHKFSILPLSTKRAHLSSEFTVLPIFATRQEPNWSSRQYQYDGWHGDMAGSKSIVEFDPVMTKYFLALESEPDGHTPHSGCYSTDNHSSLPPCPLLLLTVLRILSCSSETMLKHLINGIYSPTWVVAFLLWVLEAAPHS